MDPFREAFAKAALTGEPGDKRNTKYALAGLGGYAVGVNVGNQVGARSAGTTLTQNRREALSAMQAHMDATRADLAAHPLPKESRKERRIRRRHNRDVVRGKGGRYIPEPHVPNPSTYSPSMRTVNQIGNSIKGTKAIHRGGEAGAVIGAATGLAAYGAYRAKKREVAKYWEGTPKPERRKVSFTDAALGAGTGMLVGGAAAYALTRGKGGSKTTVTRTITRTLKPKVSRPKAAKPEAPKQPEPPKQKLAVQAQPKPPKQEPSPRLYRKPEPDKTYMPASEAFGERRTIAVRNKNEPDITVGTAQQRKTPIEEVEARPRRKYLLKPDEEGQKQAVLRQRAWSLKRITDAEKNKKTPEQISRARRRQNAQRHGKQGANPRKNAFGVEHG